MQLKMKFLSSFLLLAMLAFVYTDDESSKNSTTTAIEMDNNSQKVIDESNRLIKKAELLRQLHHAISYQQYKQLGDQCNKIRNLIHLTQTAKNQLEFDGAIKELENENQSLKDYLSHFPDIPDD
uniref:Uncharacterized protein LOC113790884 n=1 Tax=Dermatophagoides pteronyssinus TaxID=6956 RepID=A0A6P6XTY0_DERPT|nr:uncharacterized protein LOC113790884 [Dermatophagoides pteronyssinus]